MESYIQAIKMVNTVMFWFLGHYVLCTTLSLDDKCSGAELLIRSRDIRHRFHMQIMLTSGLSDAMTKYSSSMKHSTLFNRFGIKAREIKEQVVRHSKMAERHRMQLDAHSTCTGIGSVMSICEQMQWIPTVNICQSSVGTYTNHFLRARKPQRGPVYSLCKDVEVQTDISLTVSR